jgi:microcystin-dependent protein
MSTPFVAEVRILPYVFAPEGWATCDGQLMPLSQNTALFSLLGTTYGGDGRSTFALPDLQDSAPMGAGQGPALTERFMGEMNGTQTIALSESEIPVHIHNLMVSTKPATEAAPAGQRFAFGAGVGMYDTTAPPATSLAFQAAAPTGGSLPHNNMQPYLTVQYCIALEGVFPQRP